jgi:glycosyltransferase involved in cell wall biosynthesis
VKIDVSLVLNLHREGKFVLRTLLSLKDSAIFARINGIAVEIITVLDCPDPLTLEIVRAFDFSSFARFKLIEVARGSLGLARNDGIKLAEGNYVRVCDGDDLISYNLISSMYSFAEQLAPTAILHPEWLLSFGDHYYSGHHRGLDVVTPLSLIDLHPFGSEIFFHRSLFSNVQYNDVGLTAGYAFEDWHFLTEAVAVGYNLYAVPNTIIFYRQRQSSLLKNANNLSVRQIPPSHLFIPNTYLAVCAESYRQLLDGEIRREFADDSLFILSDVCGDLTRAASNIEPAIDLDLIKQASSYQTTTQSNLSIGRRYFELCAMLKDKNFSDIFLLSHFESGREEQYITDVVKELIEFQREMSIILIIGDELLNDRWLPRFPSRVTVVNVAQWLDEIGPNGIDLVTLKLVQSIGEGARLHACPGPSGERFIAAYGRALVAHKRIFYRYRGAACSDSGSFSSKSTFKFVSDCIEFIDLIVCDNSDIAEFDRRRIGVSPEKWRVLPGRYIPPTERSTAINNSLNVSRQILCISSCSDGGRPGLLCAITNLLIKKWQDTTLDIYSNSIGSIELNIATSRNIEYKGQLAKSSEIVRREYSCLVCIGVFEDISSVLLEAAGTGIPIIGPNVSALGEFVENEITGLLLPDLPEVGPMAEAYFQAVVRLDRDEDLRVGIVERAYDRAVNEYGRQSYKRNLARALAI